MTHFRYEGIDSHGKKRKGEMDAGSSILARETLRSQNIIVTSITPSQVKIAQKRYSLSIKNLTQVTRQLAVLLNAGMELSRALHALKVQSLEKKLKGLFLSLQESIEEGVSFGESLKKFPKCFPEMYISTIIVGEKSGKLEEILDQLAEYYEKKTSIQNKIQHALIYPALMLTVSIGIVSFLLVFVVPKMLDIFSEMHTTLPVATRLLLGISNGLSNHAIAITGVLLGVSLFFTIGNRWHVIKHLNHRFFSIIPLVKSQIIAIERARYARSLSMLLASGVEMTESMKIASEMTSRLYVKKRWEKATRDVTEGFHIHKAMRDTEFFPESSIQLLASGEASGQLDQMFNRVAKLEEQSIARKIDTGLALLEPLIILMMGATVLFIVLAILLPIFNLDQLHF